MPRFLSFVTFVSFVVDLFVAFVVNLPRVLRG